MVRSRTVLAALAAIALVATPVGIASAKKRRKISVPSQVVIENVSTAGGVAGTVSASRSVCEAERTVRIERNGQQVGSAQSDGDGDWNISTNTPPSNGSTFIARIEKLSVPVGTKKIVCSSDTDQFVFGGTGTGTGTGTNPTPGPTATPGPGGTQLLNLDLGGGGLGTITSSPAGINCRDDGPTDGFCSASFPTGSSVTLTATPDQGSHFESWGPLANDCAFRGSQPTCTLTMNGTRNVSATFQFN